MTVTSRLTVKHIPGAKIAISDLKDTNVAPTAVLLRHTRTERGIPYGARALWERSPNSSPSPGKPDTWRSGAGDWDDGN